MAEFFVGMYEDSSEQEFASSSCDWCWDPDQCHGCNTCHTCNTCNTCDGCYQPW